MKSKEVIQRLKDDIEIGYLSTKHDNQKDKENYLFMLEIIEKDLEVLDIIKRSIYSRESHKYVLNEKLKGQKFMNASLYISGDTDYNKIKEWLENDK